MNITRQNTDDLNAVINVSITKDDISENVEKSLKEYKRKAKVPGFRPGMVPMGLIKKMYGDALMADEINKKISEVLNKYLTDEKLNILGDPLPSDQQQPIDFATTDEYSFLFDIGLSPEFEVKLSKRDKINFYKIVVNEEMIEKQIQSHRQRFGSLIETDVTDDKSMIKGSIVETDADFNPLENGIQKDDVSLYVGIIKDEEIKHNFVGTKAGSSIAFDLKKALPSEAEISSMLGIDKKQVAAIGNFYRLTIDSIRTFTDAEMNKTLYEKATGNTEIDTEEQFREAVKNELESALINESNYKFRIDAKNKLLSKCDLKLPEDFLRRWITFANKEVTEEQLNKDFVHFMDDLRWTLIINKILKENSIEIQHDDVLEAAKDEILQQFRQYGIHQVPDPTLIKYAEEMMHRESDAKRLFEKVGEAKALEFIKTAVKLEENLVSPEEFDKLFA
ncbi:MAG: trigger factor [Bacteroidales bacterium]|nr:trigger factor [Bacteroidales bacterium]HOY39218.1 trigger factor [Bacteroidales bacterium]HQP04982.1 trigger factor [Bacteroidales bacterium]